MKAYIKFQLEYIEDLTEDNSRLFNIFSIIDIYVKENSWKKFIFNDLQTVILYRRMNFIKKIIKMPKNIRINNFNEGKRCALFINKNESYLFFNKVTPELRKIYCADKIELLNYPIYTKIPDERIVDEELNKLIESYFLLSELE
jgi:hypothetical protein